MNRRLFIKGGMASLGIAACHGAFAMPGITMHKAVNPDERFVREAMFGKITPGGVKCVLCPFNCNINEIRPGNCQTRFLKNGKLMTSAFGNPYYVKVETPEKELLYHFMPGQKILALGTAGCNLSCQYCNVAAVSQKRPDEITSTRLFPEDVIETCRNKGIKAIAYTYSEPVAFYEYMLATAKLARSKGIKNIVVSNGYINEAPLRELALYLDAAIISIKAFSDATYQKLSGGSIFPVFNTLKILKEKGVWLELSHVIVPGWTDNFDLLEKMCIWMLANDFAETPFHFRRFEPEYRLSSLSSTSDGKLKKAVDTALSAGLKFVYQPEFSTNTFCPVCKKILVKRESSKISFQNLRKGICTCGYKLPGMQII